MGAAYLLFPTVRVEPLRPKPPHPTPSEDSMNGLRHSWKQPTGAFLFSARKHWIPDSRFFASPPTVQDAMLAQQKVLGATHFVVTAHVGPGRIKTLQWDGLKNLAATRAGLQRIIDADLAPILFIASQSFPGAKDRAKLLRLIAKFVPRVEDLCSILVPMWEIGDVYRDEETRKAIMRAVRKHTKKPIGVHERSLEGAYEREVHGVAPTIQLCQFGFKTDVKTATAFVKATKRRLEKYGCVISCFEHSIPPWGPWKSVRPTLAKAKAFGKAMIKAGCSGDMNGAAT